MATVAAVFDVTAADNGWEWVCGDALTQAFANQDFGDGVHFDYEVLMGGE